MIDPKELRIGNLILCFDIESDMWCHDTVSEINPHCIITKDETESGFAANSEYKPIPITPEWLERLGFEKGRLFSYGVTKYKLNRWDGFYLLHEPDMNTIELVYIDNGIVECEYIHQLQNLYYALTGEELTLKTNKNENTGI